MSGAVGEALRRAILDDFDEDAPRLVYADWLMERGDPRGEFIRLQCEAARGALRSAARKRMGVLLRANEKAWLGDAMHRATERYDRTWRRGFLSGCSLVASAPALEAARGEPAWAFVESVRALHPWADAEVSERALRVVTQPLPRLRALAGVTPWLARALVDGGAPLPIEALGITDRPEAGATTALPSLLDSDEAAGRFPSVEQLELDRPVADLEIAARVLATRVGRRVRRLLVHADLDAVGPWQRELPLLEGGRGLQEVTVQRHGGRATLSKDVHGSWSVLAVRSSSRRLERDELERLIAELPRGHLVELSIDALPHGVTTRRLRELLGEQRNLRRLDVPRDD